jgi:hypothetical protein
MGKVSPIGWSHLYLSADFHNMFLCQKEKGEYEEVWGGGGVGADFRMSENRHHMEHGHSLGNPHA